MSKKTDNQAAYLRHAMYHLRVKINKQQMKVTTETRRLRELQERMQALTQC